MNKSSVFLSTLILCGFSVSTPALSAEFGGVSGSLGIKILNEETLNRAYISVDSYVDEEPDGSTRWGRLETSMIHGGDSFSARFDSLDIAVVSGWRAYGSGRIELKFSAVSFQFRSLQTLWDLEYGRSGISLPIYGDWIRVAIEGDLRTRKNFGTTPTQSTSIGLPISLSITTPIDRPMIVSGEVDLRAGLQVLGDESDPISVDLITSARAGYSVVQNPDINVQIYLQHDFESLYLERDGALNSQMVTLGVDLSL
jgi:hypothetical protein